VNNFLTITVYLITRQIQMVHTINTKQTDSYQDSTWLIQLWQS